MKDSLSQLLHDADASAPRSTRASGLADAVRRRHGRERVRNRVVAATCVVIGILALGFTLRTRDPVDNLARHPTPPPANPVNLAQLDVDERVSELTAQRLLSAERRQRTSPAAVTVNVQEQRDRAALVLIYEGDGYARGKRSNDAIAAYQR